jgi:hypothetical protein
MRTDVSTDVRSAGGSCELTDNSRFKRAQFTHENDFAFEAVTLKIRVFYFTRKRKRGPRKHDERVD